MEPTLSRRTVFFAIAALICLALVPATPPELRWSEYVTAGLGGFWAIALALEDLFGPGRRPRRRDAVRPRTPFEPPPRRGAG
jgi:hypothetical protein